jgi:hypothetical protein
VVGCPRRHNLVVSKLGLSTGYLFAVSRILKDGISPLMIRQKMQADDIMVSESRKSGGLETGVRKLGPC